MKIIDGKLLYYSSEFYIVYSRGYVRKINSEGIQISKVKLYGGMKFLLSKSILISRVLRLDPKCAKIMDNKVLTAYDGALSIIDFSDGTKETVVEFPDGMHSPLNIYSHFSSCHTDFVFGDYRDNSLREEVNLYVYDKHEVKVFFSFSHSTIRHIHNCFVDNEIVYVLTGDEDSESGIWKIVDGYAKKVLYGKQQYRSCVCFKNGTEYIYATDTPLEKNHIYCFDESTNKLRVVSKLPGPCIFGTSINFNQKDYYIFATSVEPDSTLKKWKYMFTRKPSKFIQDNSSHIIMGNLEDGFIDLFSVEKDILPMGLFQFGNFQFVESENQDVLVLNPVALKGLFNKSLVYSYDELYELYRSRK